MDRSTMLLVDIVDAIFAQMNDSGYAELTRNNYRSLFNRLIHFAKDTGESYYTCELGQAFINDTSHITPENSERYCRERTNSYKRCIGFIESYLATGIVNWLPNFSYGIKPIQSQQLKDCFESFKSKMTELGLKPNTIDGYRRFSYYFVEYLEGKGYKDLSEMKCGDVTTFIAVICKERYQITSLGAHMPGLKLFLSIFKETEDFITEIPEHLPKKRNIVKVYSDEEYDKIISYLNNSNNISLRNKAITIMAMNTGLRAVDICSLRLNDIDWEHDIINISQQKTGKPFSIPLTDAVGNALVDYLLNERPSNSEYDHVFLRSVTPYKPIMGHAGIRNILFNVIKETDIESNGRIYGTRITRHSAASRMLRNGVPLSVISEALGHSNKNSVMIYLSTDDAKLAECTLPLPGGDK